MTKAAADERRSHDRELAFNVRATLRERNDAAVVDLGPKGLGVETTTWLAVGTPYRIRLDVIGQSESIYLQGVVDWCTLDRVEPKTSGEAVSVYRAGIELLHMEARSSEPRDVVDPRNPISRTPGIELQVERRAAPRVPMLPLGAS